MHIFKRFYLLGTLIFALVAPVVVFTEYIEAAPITYESNPISPILNSNLPQEQLAETVDFKPFLWGSYILGVLFFGMIFLKNLVQIVKRIRRGSKHKNSNFIHVLLHEKLPPHTFLKYIFLNKTKYKKNEIPKAVLLHEESHGFNF